MSINKNVPRLLSDRIRMAASTTTDMVMASKLRNFADEVTVIEFDSRSKDREILDLEQRIDDLEIELAGEDQ